MIDIDTALREMTETQEAVADMVLSDRFRNELSRIRLDLGVSPHLPISDEMCKWVVLAYLRSTQECATNSKREPVGTLNKMETVEPVAYVTGYRDGFCVISPVEHVVFPTGMALYMSPPNQSEDALGMVEPVAYCTLEQLAHLKLTVPSEDKIAIYTAPPKREPLTDEEIEEICWTEMDRRLLSFARAIERAHGIGGEE